MTSALLALFLSKLYSSFLRPMVRRRMTSSLPVGNRLSELSNTISTGGNGWRAVRLGQAVATAAWTYRMRRVFERWRHLRGEGTAVLRGSWRCMRRKAQNGWLRPTSRYFGLRDWLTVDGTHLRRSYFSPTHSAQLRHCVLVRRVQSASDLGLQTHIMSPKRRTTERQDLQDLNPWMVSVLIYMLGEQR